MKITITVEANQIQDGLKIDRRRLNNIWANCNDEIHHFITKELDATTWESDRNMGIQPYQLTIKIEQ